MSAPQLKSLAEQRVEWLEGLRRPLTDAESDDLRRALHAVYCRNRRQRALAGHRKEELKLLRRMEREALLPSEELQ